MFDVPNPSQTIIHVHPSDAELGKILQAELPIQASPEALFEGLARQPITTQPSVQLWSGKLRAAYLDALKAPQQPDPFDMSAVMVWLQQQLPDDVIITNGAGNFSVWPNKHFRYGDKARLLAPQSGSMGYGLPAAIAAKLALSLIHI